MKCKAYIFLLTSDQLIQASVGVNLQAGWHRLICRNCRVFTQKDQALMQALHKQRDVSKAALMPPYIS